LKGLSNLITRCLLALLAATSLCGGANWYVATTGSGNGSFGSPWSLQTAITNSLINPGDNVWLLGGTYFPTATVSDLGNNVQGWKATIAGTSGNQITFASYPGQWAAIDREWFLNYQAGYLCFSNLEFYDSLKGHNLTNIYYPQGPWVHFPMGSQTGFSWVNCVIHDVDNCFGNGIYSVRGCIFWYVGWNTLEHVCYPAPASFTGNISAWHLQNVINFETANALIESNIMFGGGNTEPAIPNACSDIDGVGYNETIDHNYTYNRLSTAVTSVSLNMNSGASGTVKIFDNIWVAPAPVLQLGYGTFGTVSIMNDTNYASSTNYPAGVMAWKAISGASCDYNSYYAVPSGNSPNLPVFTLNGSYNKSFATWQSDTGFDAHTVVGTYPGQMPPNSVQVIPNADVAKRANIAIYNWTLANNVSVSLAGVLNSGDSYNLYSAQNYNGGNVSGAVPIQSGTYNGTGISVPMTNLTVAPILYGSNMSSDGVPIVQPGPTGPEFGAFVVIGSASTNAPPPLPPTDLHVIN